MKFREENDMIEANKAALVYERVKRGMSKTELAKQIGVNHSVIVRAEQEKSVSPRTAKRLCDFFDLPFETLFTIRDKVSV